jgi:hypothetical protein
MKILNNMASNLNGFFLEEPRAPARSSSRAPPGFRRQSYFGGVGCAVGRSSACPAMNIGASGFLSKQRNEEIAASFFACWDI